MLSLPSGKFQSSWGNETNYNNPNLITGWTWSRFPIPFGCTIKLQRAFEYEDYLTTTAQAPINHQHWVSMAHVPVFSHQLASLGHVPWNVLRAFSSVIIYRHYYVILQVEKVRLSEVKFFNQVPKLVAFEFYNPLIFSIKHTYIPLWHQWWQNHCTFKSSR